MALANKFKLVPTHKGPLLVGVGETGIGFTVNVVVPADPVHPATVAVTEYVPAPAKVIPDTMGF